MELFYSQNIQDDTCTLDEEESRHCTKVLRHVPGDIVHVIDGLGTLMECKILSIAKVTVLQIVSRTRDFGGHPYSLHIAVAPTKNMDRYEWFLEKAAEIGVDLITPVIGDHSERKVVKPERCEKILLSAAKQSLKGAVPLLQESCSVKDFIRQCCQTGETGSTAPLKLIAYCGDAPKCSVAQALSGYLLEIKGINPHIVILIGPEGDFSEEEVNLAVAAGFRPVHLGPSRLRTETAAVVAVSGVYYAF